MKFAYAGRKSFGCRRSPHGERGLKLPCSSAESTGILSLPARGAWIEINCALNALIFAILSPPARGAWIEI